MQQQNKISCGKGGLVLVILPSFVLKHLAVGQPLYIGDTDIIIIINKNNISR